jgi:hypothetical protein
MSSSQNFSSTFHKNSNSLNLKIGTPKYIQNPSISLTPINSINEPLTTKNSHNKKNEMVNVMSLLSGQHIPLSLNSLKQNFNYYDETKCSSKSNSYIKAYSANTHQGIVR